MKLAIKSDDAEALAEKLEVGDDETAVVAAEVTVRRGAEGELMAEAEVFV